MKKTHFLLGIILMIIAYSCAKKQNYSISSQFIEKLSSEKFEGIPSRFDFDFLFVKCDSNNIAITNLSDLHCIYERTYPQKKITFKTFLSKALNQNLIITRSQCNFTKRFILNDTIKDLYENKGFDVIKKKYYNAQKKIMISGLSESYQYSIMYYFFLNNYVVGIDDVYGCCIMIPHKDIPSLQR